MTHTYSRVSVCLGFQHPHLQPQAHIYTCTNAAASADWLQVRYKRTATAVSRRSVDNQPQRPMIIIKDNNDRKTSCKTSGLHFRSPCFAEPSKARHYLVRGIVLTMAMQYEVFVLIVTGRPINQVAASYAVPVSGSARRQKKKLISLAARLAM